MRQGLRGRNEKRHHDERESTAALLLGKRDGREENKQQNSGVSENILYPERHDTAESYLVL